MKNTTICIVNYNEPQFCYFLLKNLRKKCNLDNAKICIFDTSDYKPIIAHIDDVQVIKNTKSEYFNINNVNYIEVYKCAVSTVINLCDTDNLIILSPKLLINSDINNIIDTNVAMVYKPNTNNYTLPNITYVNKKYLTENNITLDVSNSEHPYTVLKDCIPGNKIKLLNSDLNFITPYVNQYNTNMFIDWLMLNSKLWKTSYEDAIFSLTTFKGRIYDKTTEDVLLALLNQYTRYNYKVVLVLSKDEFGKNFKLPDFILNIQNKYSDTFEILWTKKDTKPLKKLDPTMEKYPDVPIITLDDDDYCENNMLDYILYEHFDSPFHVLGTWMEETENPIKWVAGVRLFPPHCLYNFPLEDYYKYYDGILDDNFNAMRCAYKMTPIKSIKNEYTHKTNQTDLQLTRDYRNTPWGYYYSRFIIDHLDQMPEEFYYDNYT